MQVILAGETDPFILILDTDATIVMEKAHDQVSRALVYKGPNNASILLTENMQYAKCARVMRTLHKRLGAGDSPSIQEIMVEVETEGTKPR